MSISQKDGVYNAIEAFLKENGDRKIPDTEPLKLETEERKAVVQMLVAATTAGELTVRTVNKVPFEQIPADKLDDELKEYWNGALSNWLRKDTRLNGNVEYQAKSPGSRAGAGDGQLKNLKLLLKQVEAKPDSDEKMKAVEQINAAIKTRTEQIAAEKAKALEVNISLIPDSLKHLVSNSTEEKSE